MQGSGHFLGVMMTVFYWKKLPAMPFGVGNVSHRVNGGNCRRLGATVKDGHMVVSGIYRLDMYIIQGTESAE